jgi:hypothetical protein
MSTAENKVWFLTKKISQEPAEGAEMIQCRQEGSALSATSGARFGIG